MDQRDVHLQTLGICNKLYNFIKKTLLAQPLKTVTLGDPLHKNLFKSQNKGTYGSGDQMLNSRAQQGKQCQGVGQANGMRNSNTLVSLSGAKLPSVQDDDANVNSEKLDIDSPPGKTPEEETPLCLVEAKAPKKTVSINDRVEEIDTSKKKIRRKKSKENLASSEKEDEPKPLKSILKGGPYSGEKSSSFVDPPVDG